MRCVCSSSILGSLPHWQRRGSWSASHRYCLPVVRCRLSCGGAGLACCPLAPLIPPPVWLAHIAATSRVAIWPYTPHHGVGPHTSLFQTARVHLLAHHSVECGCCSCAEHDELTAHPTPLSCQPAPVREVKARERRVAVCADDRPCMGGGA